MISITIAKDFSGPTIVEMSALLPVDAGVFAWNNTKEELRLLKQQPEGDYTLVVPSLHAMETAAFTLGISCPLPEDVLIKSLTAINSPKSVWRHHTASYGVKVSGTALLNIAARQSRKGKDIRHLRKIMVESILHNTSAADADVLLGIRSFSDQ